MRTAVRFRAFLAALSCFCASACSDQVRPPTERAFSAPETELTYGPAESDTTTFRVHFYWAGHDKDGEVVRFRWAMDADTARPIPEWRATTAKDTILSCPVDPATAVRRHVFVIASEDNDGRIDPTPARRFFSARTIPPTACITRGPSPNSPYVLPAFTFEWRGEDPDGGIIGNGGDVDSFEYLLLKVGALSDSVSLSHEPLPSYNLHVYVDLVNRATGDALPEPHADWKWVGVRGGSRRFVSILPGEYVLAVRAVDEAGARERVLEYGCNIRHFTVVAPSAGMIAPRLRICTDALLACLGPVSASDPWRTIPVEVLEGETISFSWSATPGYYGGEIAGYSYALNDSTALGQPDPARTGVTLTPDLLPEGTHFLFVRVVDAQGYTTRMWVPIHVIRPAFRDPAHGRSILYVDDSTAPGVYYPGQDEATSIGNFPNDVTETEWWTLELLNGLGVPVTEWDATPAGVAELQGRKPPPLRALANYSTVIWNVDFNNSITNPTALWRTLVGDLENALRTYVRGGGTLILTGFDVSSNTVNPSTTFEALSASLCAAFEPGSGMYSYTYVPRAWMGIDGVVPNRVPLRRDGARDFISAHPTGPGSALGFDSVRVDRGPQASGAKWITNLLPLGDPEVNSSPGLGRVDGWRMATSFSCAPNPLLIRVEDPGLPIAEPILLYHGVNRGVNEDGGPSPREDLVVGIRVQAHDEGESFDPDGPYGGELGNVAPGSAQGLYGRMVHFSFPFFWLKDEDAIRAMRAAFQYVNASPTLP